MPEDRARTPITGRRAATRREFLATGLLALAARSGRGSDTNRIDTPYKLGKYVLSASGEEDSFDKVSVDCPFVFRHEGEFLMTFVGFDGIGYQTGLASSADLINWKKEGCILKVFYYGLDAKGVARDLAATSPDLLHATKYDGFIIDIGPKGSIDSAYAHKPSLIQYQGDLYHYYCAVSGDFRHEVRGISVARSRPWGKEVL